MTCFEIDASYETDTIDLATVAKRSHGESTQRVLPAERHEVGNYFSTVRNVSDTSLIEYGHADVNVVKVNSHVDRLFAGLGDGISAFMSHFDKLASLPTVSIDNSTTLKNLLTLSGVCGCWLPPRTQSMLASLTRRSPSLVCLS